jgi:hypothetical protein
VNNKYQQLKGEYNILEKQYMAQKENAILLEQFRQKEKDSIVKLINKRTKEVVIIKTKIVEIQKKPINTPKTLQSSVDYYNNKYKTEENKVVEDKVGLSFKTSTEVITDLEEGVKCEEISVLKDSVISNLEEDKKNFTVLLFSAEKKIEADKQLQNTAEQNIKNLQKQNKNLKTKNFITTYIIPPTMFFLGTQLKK